MILTVLPNPSDPPCRRHGEAHAQEKDVEAKSKEACLYRQELSYRTMSADNTVCHESDIRRLPAGAIIIKRFRKYAYEQISRLVEHDYEVIRYKTPEGKIREGYFPFSGQPEIIDVVLGTYASGSFLAYLAFNKYVLDTHFYREMYDCPVSGRTRYSSEHQISELDK